MRQSAERIHGVIQAAAGTGSGPDKESYGRSTMNSSGSGSGSEGNSKFLIPNSVAITINISSKLTFPSG